MTTYNIPSKQKTLLMGGMAIGIICLALTWFFDSTGHHTRFWSNFLHNTVFFTGIALMAIFFYSVCHTAWAGWHIQFKRVWEAMSMFLGVGIILMGIMALGLVFGWHDLYHWADQASIDSDELLQHKSAFLNKTWYIVSIGFVGLLYFMARKVRALSTEEDRVGGPLNFTLHNKARWWNAFVLPIVGVATCIIFWQWVMSIDAHWYSTLFAWYSGASVFVSMIAMTILLLILLKSKGYYKNVSDEHFHDLGKFMFAFTIFWTYLWFSQYMLIWYSNNGEETVYFNTRQDHYPVLFYGNLAVNFLLPFFILMRNDTKRKMGTLITVSLIVIFGHWMDFFLMIKPGALHTAHALGGDHHGAEAVSHGAEAGGHGASEVAGHGVDIAHGAASTFEMGFSLPGFLELGTMVGFLSLFLYVFYVNLSKANLVPKNDPYLSESLHHHV